MKESLEKRIENEGRLLLGIVGIVLVFLVLLALVPVARMPVAPIAALLVFFTEGPGFIALLLLCLTAWLLSTYVFLEIIRSKGYFRKKGGGWLWFIGVFATPIVPGIIAIALPEKTSDEGPVVSDDLPDF
ncbi:hypothetical protein [Adlercreutzia caecimuris]|uniref:Cardiolipin synthase N-terminal domain-containing protein n=1 Tax=Adlercreutzia caecimuris B7 TaxID=1235794 RepID=R9L157_9ACTN|nr:hypothetical protein [Adlercreutzia caecimuris]EOS52375.1 hypothetical protein C811_00405 [Adlercreutzia caecimuris B7]